mgnify:CR=1 FL=1
MLAYDYPLLGLFWTALILFLWIAWIVLVVRVIMDIFRSDIGGAAKAFWCIFVVLIPWLGVLVYLIAHGSDMTRRDVETAQAQQAAVDSYIRNAAGGVSAADELNKLAELRERGLLSEEEFAAQKAKILGI